jgi:hypothetical protein
MAKCPGHPDRVRSLSIKELADGTILIHDFAGCSAADVVAAVGLELKDLFPARSQHHRAPARDRKHWHAAREALRVLDVECLIVAVMAENVAAGVVLDDIDRARLMTAATRIREAAEVVV